MNSTLPSAAEIDYIIGLNAHEESRLPELVADVTQTYREISKPEATSLLRKRLTQLILEGRVGVGECSLPGCNDASEGMRQLPIQMAIDIVVNDRHWEWEPIPNQPLIVLFAVDMDIGTLAAAAREAGAHGS